MGPLFPNPGRAQGTVSPSPGGPQPAAPCDAPLLPHPHPSSAPRLQEDLEEERATSPGDKCAGPVEGPDPDPKAGGLSESGGGLLGMRGSCRGAAGTVPGGRGSCQSSDPCGPVPEWEPGLEVSGAAGGNPHAGGAPAPLGTARLQLPRPVTPVARKLHPATWPHPGTGATSASPAVRARGDRPLR